MVAALLLLFVSPQLLAEGEQLRVMTFNIRYDNKGDSAQQWSLRKAGVAQLLNSHTIDLLGAQEVLKNQLEDLVAMLPHHNFIGVGRDDGKEAGEYAPLFYDTRRFQLKEGGLLLAVGDARGGEYWLGRGLCPHRHLGLLL